jgi:NADPH-dependent 2,4-dienoyl-CoA reductase/sulfur reductase-like enzyme
VEGKAVTCFHNLDVGREFLKLSSKPPSKAKRLLIVGAGPAGLKAAETAIRRGHHPIIVDEQSEPGGRLRFVRATAAKSLYGSVQWLVQEIELGGGELLLSKRFDADDVRNLEPDAVVLATGARPDVSGAFTGADQEGVLTVDQAVAGIASVGRRVVVLDRMGSNEAALAAEALIKREVQVLFVTTFERIVPNAGYTHRLDLRDIFRRSPMMTVLTDSDVQRFYDGMVTVIDRDGLPIREVATDAVIVATHAVPDTSLHGAADVLGVPVWIVGDALAARGALTAMREAEDAVTAI